MSQLDYGNRGRQPAKNRVLVLVLCVVILCMVSFALGIMVGKSGSETASVPQPPPVPQKAPIPPQPQSVVAQPPVVEAAPEKVAEPVAQAAVDADAAPVADPLKELLPEPEQMPLGSGINQPTLQPVTLPNAEPPAAPDRLVEQPVVAKTAERAPQTVEPPVPVVAPTVTSDVSAPHYVVQVASFKKNSDAVALQKKLSTNFPVQVRKVDLGAKGVWYRVLVGPAASSDEAKELLVRLQQKAKLSGFIKKVSS